MSSPSPFGDISKYSSAKTISRFYLAITLKLEFVAGFVILSLTPSTDVLKVS